MNLRENIRAKVNGGLERITTSKPFKFIKNSSLIEKAAFLIIVPGATYVLASYYVVKYISCGRIKADDDYKLY